MKPWQINLCGALLAIPIAIGIILGAYGLWWFPLIAMGILAAALGCLGAMDRPWDRFSAGVKIDD